MQSARGVKKPKCGKYKLKVKCHRNGIVKKIDNRRIAKIAKLAGAPQEPGAGVLLFTPLGTKVHKGDVLYTVYAEAPGELHYAMEYLRSQKGIIVIE